MSSQRQPSIATTASSRPSIGSPSSPPSSRWPYVVRALAPGRYVIPRYRGRHVPPRALRTDGLRYGRGRGPAVMDEHRPKRRGGLRRWLAAGAGVLVCTAALGGAALWRFVDHLGPLDMSRLSQGSTVVLDRDGRLLRAFTTADGRWRLPVTTGDVDPRFLTMLQAFEDRRFMSHPGVDVLALARAAGQGLRNGRIVSGGSTLTMQVARLLEPREERSLAAKLRQMVRAVQIERVHSKAEILDFYLTLAPYGGNVEGLRAASLTYLGKEPKRLTPAEAALLVALPQSPETRRPDRFAQAARAARDRVLARVAASAALNGADLAAIRDEPVPTARRPVPMLAAHAAEAALRAAPAARLHRLTIDARLQANLEFLLRERVAPLGPRLSAAMIVIDNASGAVLAHVGGWITSRRSVRAAWTSRSGPLAGLRAEAVHLRARFRERHRPSRDHPGGSPVALRPLRPREFRPDVPGRGHRAARAAAIAERPRRRASRRDRPRQASRPPPQARGRCRRARRSAARPRPRARRPRDPARRT